MFKRVFILVSLSFIMGGAVFVGKPYSQDNEPTPDKAGKSSDLLKVIKKDGWDIPGIDENETYWNGTIYVQNMPVVTRNYPLEKTFDTNIEFYSLDTENNLIIGSRTIEVKFVSTYYSRGNLFAYQINGSPFGYTPGGDRVRMGVLYKVFYFDEDGDGKFETRYIALEIPEHIPDWARQ